MQKSQGSISFSTAVLMGINIIVGSGIFISSKDLALAAGSMSIWIYPLVGLLLIPVAWSVAEAARIFPGAGGFYNYSKIGFGSETMGFMANWLYLLGYLGTASTQLTGIRSVILVGQFHFMWADQHPFLFNFIFIAILSLLNLLSLEVISKIQGLVTILKVLPLIAVIAIFGFYWNPDFTFKAPEALGMLAAIPAAAFSFWGFESCCSIGHLVKGGAAKASQAILVAFGLAIVLYSLFYFGVMNIMGLQNLAIFDVAGFPNFLGLGAGLSGGLLFALICAILVCMINGNYGVTLFNITNFYTLASEKMLFASNTLVKTNKNGRPYILVAFNAVVVLALVTFITSLKVFFGFIALGVVPTFLLTSLSVLLTHKRNGLFGRAFLAGLSVIICAVLIIFSWMSMGDDFVTRLMFASPIFVGAVLGLVMFKIQKSKTVAGQ